MMNEQHARSECLRMWMRDMNCLSTIITVRCAAPLIACIYTLYIHEADPIDNWKYFDVVTTRPINEPMKSARFGEMMKG